MRRRSILQLIAETSPQRPACFNSHAEWVEWLTSAHQGGERVVRRVDTGKWSGNRVTYFEVLPVGLQRHCEDCTSIRRSRMQAERRCFPVRPRQEVLRAGPCYPHRTAQLALFAMPKVPQALRKRARRSKQGRKVKPPKPRFRQQQQPAVDTAQMDLFA